MRVMEKGTLIDSDGLNKPFFRKIESVSLLNKGRTSQIHVGPHKLRLLTQP